MAPRGDLSSGGTAPKDSSHTNPSEDGAGMGDPPDAILSASSEARPSWKVPCTAAKGRTCQIVDHLPKLNKLLCSIEFRLRELSEGDGQLAVVLSHTLGFTCFAEEGRRQAFGLLAWLLMSHPCVTSLYANEDFLRELRRGFLRGVLNDGNSALKSLKLDNRSGHHSETVRKIIASTAQLERLEVLSQGLDREIATAIVEALRTNMLTVLNLTVGSYTNDDAVDALLEALKANSTLRELSVNDNLFSARRGRMKAAFTEYLEANSTLERLRIYSTQDDFLKSVLTGMRTNKSVSNLNLFFHSFNSETFRLLEGVFSENVVLRSLTISIVSEHIASSWEEGLEGWLKGLAQNRGLQYMRFPFVIIPQGGWCSLFEAVSTHRSLKEVVVELLDPHYYEVPGFNDYGRQDRLYYALLDACKILENSGAKDKVKFVFKASCPYTLDNDASVPRPFSLPIEAMTRPSMDLLEQSRSIASCRMTELRVELPFLRRNSSAVVQYIKETTTLRKLFLSDRIELNEAGMDSIWSAILESLSENASIREVTVYARSDCAESLERLGEIVKSSRTIRSLNIYALQSLQMVPRYAGRSPIEISSNYSLCSFRLLPDRDMMGMWAFDWSAWYNTAWRNSDIVARAARFVKCTMCDRRCAGALETVSRHPALMEELAEVLSLSDAELASLVRTRLREIQNVHDFMRLAGVVKDTVTCQPREDGRKQLHDLNEDCWGHVRRYLLFDDVRDSFETAHYVALQ